MGQKKVRYTEEENKKAAHHRLKEKRVNEKTAIRIHIEYKWVKTKKKTFIVIHNSPSVFLSFSLLFSLSFCLSVFLSFFLLDIRIHIEYKSVKT